MERVRQDTRLLRIQTPLGPDAMIPIDIRGAESVSTPFEYSVSVSAEAEIDPMRLLGQPAVVTLTREVGDDHHFHGITRSMDYCGHDAIAGAHAYTLSLVPDLWQLSRHTDCRIFQDKTAPQIVEDILTESNIVNYRMRLTENYNKKTYCVQYRETSLSFINRLLEEEGIFYYFSHSKDRHMLIFSDSPMGFATDGGALKYRRPGMEADDDSVTDWSETADLTSGRVGHTDWNYETPMLDLSADTTVNGAPPSASGLEAFEYPGRYDDRETGERRARVRAQAQEAHRTSASASTNAPSLRAGAVFTLQDHSLTSANTRYVVLGTTFEATNNLGVAGAGYRAHIRMLRSEQPFRPAIRTARPRVDGLQTAIVVGPPGEEVHTDKLARVKVRFPWDRRGRNDASASCWLRVAQASAGVGWGAQWLPRVGMEVLVGFINGDPDRPIVSGVLYNGANTPAHSLPDKALLSSWRSISSPGGGGFNELTFDDAKNSERVFLHAQKRFDSRVGHDSYEWVGGTQHQIVKGERRSLVEGDAHGEVRGDLAAKIKGDLSLTLMNDAQIAVGGDVMSNVGGEVALHAREAITLRVGASQIRITPSGIALIGPMIRLNSGGGGADRLASPESPKAPGEAAKSSVGEKSKLPKEKRLNALRAKRSELAQADAFRQAAATASIGVQSCPDCFPQGA